jgi:hypothetical protein
MLHPKGDAESGDKRHQYRDDCQVWPNFDPVHKTVLRPFAGKQLKFELTYAQAVAPKATETNSLLYKFSVMFVATTIPVRVGFNASSLVLGPDEALYADQSSLPGYVPWFRHTLARGLLEGNFPKGQNRRYVVREYVPIQGIDWPVSSASAGWI